MVHSELCLSVRALLQNTNWGIYTVSGYGFNPKVYAVSRRPVDEYHYRNFLHASLIAALMYVSKKRMKSNQIDCILKSVHLLVTHEKFVHFKLI